MSSMSDADSIFRDFETSFPFTAEKTVEYRPISDFRISVVLNDGSKVIYNRRSDSIISYQTDTEIDTEEKWRIRFGLCLYDMLREKIVTQKELSSLTGITEQTLSRYIRGHITPSAYNLRKIARALDCSIEELTDYDN